MAMFVEETRLTDGTAHAEVTRIDSNGLYEEDRAGERAAVEHALVQGYLQHVAHACFASVSFPTGTNPALGNSHLESYTLQPAPYNLHSAPPTLHPEIASVSSPTGSNSAPYNLLLKPCTLRLEPYTLHLAPHTLHPHILQPEPLNPKTRKQAAPSRCSTG